MSTRDLKPRTFYTLCTSGTLSAAEYGAGSLLKVWATDYYAKPERDSLYPSGSLLATEFDYPSPAGEGVFKWPGRIFLGNSNCLKKEVYLKPDNPAQYQRVLKFDFGKTPPGGAQILYSKFVNFDVINNPMQRVSFFCPAAKSSGCNHGVSQVYLAEIAKTA